MVMLLVFCGCSDAPNEFGNQVSELLLAARGKPMKDRRRNEWNTALMVGHLMLLAPHAFPPLPA
jgi:hypothetical protein